jgi:hypothetical protein
MSGSAITQGIGEIAHPQDAAPPHRVRMAGGGRKKISETYPHYERELESLLDSSVIGDPEKTLRHISKSAGNRKVNSGWADHPDREAQFQHIKRLTKKAIKRKNPVLSVDARKKEVLGAYKNGGKEWHKKGENPAVSDHDLSLPTRPTSIRMGYTIWKPIPPLSMWEPTMIRAALRSPPYTHGGRRCGISAHGIYADPC